MWTLYLLDTTDCCKCLTRPISSAPTSQDYSLATHSRFVSFLLDLSFSWQHSSSSEKTWTNHRLRKYLLAAMSSLLARLEAVSQFHRCLVSQRRDKQQKPYLVLLKRNLKLTPSKEALSKILQGVLSSAICISAIPLDNSMYWDDSTWELSQTNLWLL